MTIRGLEERGAKVAEIASLLGVSERTVRYHARRMRAGISDGPSGQARDRRQRMRRRSSSGAREPRTPLSNWRRCTAGRTWSTAMRAACDRRNDTGGGPIRHRECGPDAGGRTGAGRLGAFSRRDPRRRDGRCRGSAHAALSQPWSGDRLRAVDGHGSPGSPAISRGAAPRRGPSDSQDRPREDGDLEGRRRPGHDQADLSRAGEDPEVPRRCLPTPAAASEGQLGTTAPPVRAPSRPRGVSATSILMGDASPRSRRCNPGPTT